MLRTFEVLASDFSSGLTAGWVVGFSIGILLVLIAARAERLLSPPRAPSLRGHSILFRIVSVVLVLAAIAAVSYALKLDKTGAMLLLLLSVLLIARLEGPGYGVAASVLASGVLSFLFLPPIGSLRVTGPDNQLALALFLISTAVGSRLVGGQHRLS